MNANVFEKTIKTRSGNFVSIQRWNWDTDWTMFVNIAHGSVNIKLSDGDMKALRDVIDYALEGRCTSPTE